MSVVQSVRFISIIVMSCWKITKCFELRESEMVLNHIYHAISCGDFGAAEYPTPSITSNGIQIEPFKLFFRPHNTYKLSARMAENIETGDSKLCHSDGMLTKRTSFFIKNNANRFNGSFEATLVSSRPWVAVKTMFRNSLPLRQCAMH